MHLLVDILNKNPLVVQYKTHKIVYKYDAQTKK
jgi:hypothetical protein